MVARTARKLSVPTGLLTELSEPMGAQGNSPVSNGSLTEQSEPIRDRTRITSTGPEKGC